MIFQKGWENVIDYLDWQEKTPYGLTDAHAENKIICQFFIGTLRDNPLFIDDVAAEFSFDSVDDDELIKIPTGFWTGRILHLKTYTDGRTKFIKFSDTVNVEPQENKNDQMDYLDIKIKEIGFSLISQISKQERKEIAYIFMKEIAFQKIETPEFKEFNFSIDNFQIDNQVNYNVLFPVMLRPTNKKKDKPAIDWNVTIKKNDRNGNQLENLMFLGKFNLLIILLF